MFFIRNCFFISVIAGSASCFAATPIDFNREVRPILSDNCFACHGPDEKHRKAKLRLDIRDIATSTHDSVQAIKPKDLKSSEVWRRITTKDADDLMPPPESNKKLTSQQIDILRRWILEGAEYKGHWAWEAPVKISPPKIKISRWAKNPIDQFIAAKLAEKKFAPEVEATKETLIRRVTFDLTGLPPTIEEVNAFLADKKSGAYERVVDRLLQSPRYGEQQARYWLDAVRYGDTHGLHLDNERLMWPYRDWVVEAFNKNLPFDKFTVWQIAGDLLPNATREQKVASGYNRCNITTSEGGAIDDEFYVRYAADRTETTTANWMALTAGCATCHDHKFDPVSQKEFYSLYAFFNNNNEKAMDGNIALPPPSMKLPSAEQEKERAELDQEIAAAKKAVEAAVENFDYKESGPTELEKIAAPREVIVFEDEIPAGAASPELQLVTAENGKVFSGKKAIKRVAPELAQDVFENLATPLIVGTNDKLFTYIYIDPTNAPKAIMLQFKTTDWAYRANWGDNVAIPFGDKKPGKKVQMGDVPKAGEWVRLEIETDKLEIKPGLRITGIAFTQFGGTVFWDKAGAVTALAQKDRSTESLWAWETHQHAENGMTLPKEISALIKKTSPSDAQKKLLKDYYVKNVFGGTRAVTDPLNAKLKIVQDKRNDLETRIPATLVYEEMAKPRGAFVLKRGEYDKRGDEVQPGTPKFLPALPQTEKTNRLTFANWLVATNHPLTSRVIVNRYWQQFFGVGLVKTSQDFGSQGEPPSHPELLDWLAIHFMESGWDVKAFHRLIVTSATYRQDSRVSEIKYQADPENRLLARGSRFRLDAEQIRDNALFLAGLLNEKMGGRAVRPYQPEGIWEAVAYTKSDTANYTQDHGDALYRRSLYTFWKRTAAPASMTTFDAPSREKYCVRRERTDTPLQALATMNDIQFVEAARVFAQRMILHAADSEQRLEFGFKLAIARPPTSKEKSILKQTLEKHLQKYESDSEAAGKLITVGESPANKNLKPSELAAYTMVASLLLNLDETLNKN